MRCQLALMSASKPKKVFKDLSSSTSTANSDQKKKREPYNKLSEEKKEEIGKRAAERGVKDTIDYYQNREDLNLKKRSVYQLKRKYAGGDLPEKNGEELEKNGEELEKNGEELEKNGGSAKQDISMAVAFVKMYNFTPPDQNSPASTHLAPSHTPSEARNTDKHPVRRELFPISEEDAGEEDADEEDAGKEDAGKEDADEEDADEEDADEEDADEEDADEEDADQSIITKRECVPEPEPCDNGTSEGVPLTMSEGDHEVSYNGTTGGVAHSETTEMARQRMCPTMVHHPVTLSPAVVDALCKELANTAFLGRVTLSPAVVDALCKELANTAFLGRANCSEVSQLHKDTLVMPVAPPPQPIPQDILDMSDKQLRVKLVSLGENPGPVNSRTRSAYQAYLAKVLAGVQPQGNKTYKEYEPELSLVLNGTALIPDLAEWEQQVFQSFRGATPLSASCTPRTTPSGTTSRPGSSKKGHLNQTSSASAPQETPGHQTPSASGKPPGHQTPSASGTPPGHQTPSASWTPSRPGSSKKDHYNYLLLDPRVLNEPAKSELERFRVFTESVFYVGKGEHSRSFQHLKEASSEEKDSSKKLERIRTIWSQGRGVMSLHVFNNTISDEALSREACLIEAIGLKILTNKILGSPKEVVRRLQSSERRLMGVHLLYKTFQIYKLDTPQEIFEEDIIPKQRNKLQSGGGHNIKT